MSKLKILRVITRLPVGGIERKIVAVLPRLDPARFEASVVCIKERGPLAKDLEDAGIRVDCIPFRSRWDPRGMRALAALMRERQIDLVHSHMYRSNVPATVAARMAGVRHVWGQVHNVDTWETRRQAAMDRWLCRWREGMIAVSEQVRRDVIETLRLPPEKVRLIYNGVDLEEFGSGEGREALRTELGTGPEDVVFLLAARIVEQKRPQDFLELARWLVEQEKAGEGRARPKIHFWIAGDGGMLDSMKAMARDASIADRIHFLGRRDDIARVMAAADVFVMPSTKEGFSNALTEAMASGLAIVATDVGGNAEAIRDGVDGLIIPPLDSGSLRAATERILMDGELRRSLQTSARQRAERFSLTNMIRNVETLYEESAGEPK